jgi:hypothetical protein
LTLENLVAGAPWAAELERPLEKAV